MKKLTILTILIIVGNLSFSQDNSYVSPADPLVSVKLEHWKDWKFGLLMHWGTYSQWGIVESWSLCGEDEGWCQRKGPFSSDYYQYKKAYENLVTTFNPVMFDPDKWAMAARFAGMKYVVFTTKHHDGFCMFNTHQTDYKITSKSCPFNSNPRANITQEIFRSFRKQGFGIGAYFSKPDWHSNDYWWPYFPAADRNVNYDPVKYPEVWQRFRDFTFNQIKELMSDYGNIDILWLDGGWVRPKNKQTEESKKWVSKIYDQDIDMPSIASMARLLQPGLIIVDRSVPGEFENYCTPEQQVPEKPLPYPWETCMTMATSWSYVPNDTYKPAFDLIQLLAKIVSRGGNLLLNIGVSPTGEWDDEAYNRLYEIGDWMNVNSDALYGTEPVKPYQENNIVFTRKKDGFIYAIFLAGKSEETLPSRVVISSFQPKQGTNVYMMGEENPLVWKKLGKGFVIEIPGELRVLPPCEYAWAFRFTR
ncbi:MAG: alpha-L-fucosidase [Bacteroidia bacterium]|nr:alpha-L-fucosidase [Bacteroidia bacterium]